MYNWNSLEYVIWTFHTGVDIKDYVACKFKVKGIINSWKLITVSLLFWYIDVFISLLSLYSTEIEHRASYMLDKQ